jgi:hypothetical protein
LMKFRASALALIEQRGFASRRTEGTCSSPVS